MRGHLFERWLPPLLAGGGLLAAWALLVWATGTRIFPSPAAVGHGLWELVESGALLSYVWDSLRRVLIAFSLSIAVGVPLGVAMGRSVTVSTIFNPVIQALRPISPLAWIPVSILLFGIGDLAMGFLIFLASVCPLAVSAYTATRNVPVIYLRAGDNFGLPRRALFFRVLLPAALPELLTGLRVALGIAWLVVVTAEMIAADSGLGFLIVDARNSGKRYDLVLAGMLLIGVIGLTLDIGLRRIERIRSVRWGFR
jgi:NitT/TauT family transport system permease protein